MTPSSVCHSSKSSTSPTGQSAGSSTDAPTASLSAGHVSESTSDVADAQRDGAALVAEDVAGLAGPREDESRQVVIDGGVGRVGDDERAPRRDPHVLAHVEGVDLRADRALAVEARGG